MRRFASVLAIAVLATAYAPAAAAAEDLQALIDAAEPGSVLVIPAGDYDGPITIDKPLELRGEGRPRVDGHGQGSVINVAADDVTLTGLVVANTGSSLEAENAGISVFGERVTVVGNQLENVLFGIYLRGADDSYIADNVVGAMERDVAKRGDGIRLWESSGTLIERNTVDGGRDTVLWFSDDLILRDNSFTNGRYGIHFMYSDRAIVERNFLSGNSVGGFLMYSHDLTLRDNLVTNSQGPSGYGIGLKDIDGVEATGNRFIGNRIGVYFDNSPSTPGLQHQFSNNLFAFNETGAAFLPSVEGNVFTNNAFVDNGEQVGVQGSGDFEGNIWTIEGVGNHWSDFAGYDANRDGVGDIPYRLVDLFSTLTDKNADLHFFDQTPAAQAIDLAAEMFPAFRPRPKVEDTSPLMEMPYIPRAISAPAEGSVAATLAVSLLMLVAAGGLLLLSRSPLGRART